MNQAFMQLFKDFLKNSASSTVCPHCKNHQPQIKKEGHNKFMMVKNKDDIKTTKVIFNKKNGQDIEDQ